MPVVDQTDRAELRKLVDAERQALANGPIMDPSSLYLPAGKISMAETRAREAANLEQLT